MMVLLAILAPDDGAPGVRPIVDEQGSIFTLEVTGRNATAVRARTFRTAGRSVVLLRFGGSRTRGRGDRATRGLGLAGGLALLLPPGGIGLSLAALAVVVRGKDVVTVALGPGTTGER